MVAHRSLLFASLISTAAAAQPTFTPMPQSDAGTVDGGKEGGAIVVDLTDDRCPDVVVNTVTDSRLLLGSCDGGFPLFTDVTDTHASGMTRTLAERSVVAADLNNDGARDVVRNSDWRLEVFLNAGPLAVPPYRLGDAAGDPQRELLDVDFEGGGINLEGVAVLDYDADGWLDIAVQNSGVELLRNPRDGTAAFTVATSSADRHGLPTGLANGDYATAADVDADGDVDLLVRNVTGPVLWLNDGTGRFAGAASFTPVADEMRKSGTALCDFDGDGALDIYWGGVSAAQPDELWTQGLPGTFARGPAPNGSGFSSDVACGDLDHDGDVDLALANADGVRLLINQGAGTFVAFDPPELAGGPALAVVLADMDHDGDLDLYANRTGENGVWRNELDDGRSLSVALRTQLPGRAERDAIGASAVLTSCTGDVLLSPRRELSGGRGHGTQDPPVLHFGLPPGPPQPLLIKARFVGGAIRRRAIDPANLSPGLTVTVRESDPDLVHACNQPVVVPLADAPHPHSFGATALLPDGRLLFFAGELGEGSADLLDPFLGGWTLGSSPNPRAYIGAVTLPSSEILSMDFGLEPCILYTPDAGTWRTCVPPATQRDNNQLIVLPEGGALYIGGREETSSLSSAVDRFDPIQEQWTVEPSMSEVRAAFAGALLDDGTILVVGADSPTVSTERRALDGGWMDGGSLPDPAVSPCLVRLWDGRVLAGNPGRSLLYDPGTATWTDLSGAGGLNDCAAAALLPDGRAAAVFDPNDTAWIFDPLAETWQPGPLLPGLTGKGYSGLLPTGRWAILSASGVDLLDPASEGWLEAPPPPSRVNAASLTLLSDGEVLQAGGTADVATSEVFRFAPGSGWRAAAPLHLARSGHHATLLADGRVLVTGGTPRPEPELYDPVSDSWTLLPAAAATGAPHSATPLLDGRVLIVSESSASFFDPATLSFQGDVPLTASRLGHTATRLLDGRVLLAGGGTASSEVFTPGPDSFTPSGDMTLARSGASAVLMPGGEVLVLGGTSAELWTPTSGAWTAAGTLATARAGHGALLLRNGKVLLTGGQAGSGSSPAEPELFDPIAQSGKVVPAGIAPTAQARATRLGDGRVLLVGATGARYLDEGRGGLARAPALTSAALDGGTLIVSGSGWLSAPQGVDGQLSSASANFPVLYLERPDTLEIRPAPLSSWTNQGGFAPVTPSLGTTGAFVVVTGVASVQQLFHVGLADAGCASSEACATRRCEANVCCQTCADGTCRVGGCPGEPPDAGVDGGQGPPRNLLVRCGCNEGGIGPLLFGLLLLFLLGCRRRGRLAV